MSNETQWYEANTGSDQGLVVEERTGRNVAVSYDKKDARLIAAAPEMAELLERLAANCAADRYVERLTYARDARALLAKIKGADHA